jgi:hypothetical protein
MNITIYITSITYLLSIIVFTLSIDIYTDNKEAFKNFSNMKNLLLLPNDLKEAFKNYNISPTISYISEISIFEYINGPNLNSDILIFQSNNKMYSHLFEISKEKGKPIAFMKMNRFPKNEKMKVYSEYCKVYKYEEMKNWVIDNDSKIVDMKDDYNNILFYINDWGVYAIGCNSDLISVIYIIMISLFYLVCIVI